MTIPERTAPGTVREVTLTQEEILTAVGHAALLKANVEGEWRNSFQFHVESGWVIGATVTMVSLAPGESGKPPMAYGPIAGIIG